MGAPARRKGGPRGLSAVLSRFRAPRLKREIRLNYVSCSNRISQARGQRLFFSPDRPGWSAERPRPRGAARHSKTGFDSDKRNACGYSWSSSIAGANAHNLGFSYSWLTPQNSNYRAYGFPLRCLQEEVPLGTPTEPAGKKAGQPVWPPTPRRGPTLSGRINLFPLPRSSRGGSYFL